MAYVAAIIWIFFLRALLRIDRQCAPGLSKAVWLPTVWIIYCATRPLSQWLHVEYATQNVVDGSPLDRNFIILLCVVGVAILVNRRINWAEIFQDNFWLVALFAFMLVSVLWSDFMFVSFKRWVRSLAPVIMALVVLTDDMPYEAIHAVFRRTCYFVISLSALLVKYFPHFGVKFGRWDGAPMYCGATVHKNTLGEIGMIWCFLWIWTYFRRKEGKEPALLPRQNLLEWALLAMTFYLMKGPSGYGASEANYSATSIVTLAAGLAVLFILQKLRKHSESFSRWVFIIVMSAGILVLAMKVFDISPAGIVAPLVGRKANLTDRTTLIWAVLLPIAYQHPILGLGFGSFWITPVPDLTLDINEAHNGYLDVFIEVGAVGLALLALVAFTYFRKAIREMPQDYGWASFRLTFLAMMLLHNFSETSYLRSTFLLWNLFILFLIAVPKGKPEQTHSDADERLKLQEDEQPFEAVIVQ